MNSIYEQRQCVRPGRYWAAPTFALLAAMFIIGLVSSIHAQTDAPPPVAAIPKGDRDRLESKGDIKDRTKTAVEMMNDRLSSAEKLRSAEDYDGLFRELGIFQGLVDNSLDYLLRRSDGGRALDNLKRLEIALRTFIPRLETIRRDVPAQYEDYVDKLMKAIRDARSKATEPMFSNTVVPNLKSGN